MSEKLSNSIDSLCFGNFFYAILQNDEKSAQKIRPLVHLDHIHFMRYYSSNMQSKNEYLQMKNGSKMHILTFDGKKSRESMNNRNF